MKKKICEKFPQIFHENCQFAVESCDLEEFVPFLFVSYNWPRGEFQHHSFIRRQQIATVHGMM